MATHRCEIYSTTGWLSPTPYSLVRTLSVYSLTLHHPSTMGNPRLPWFVNLVSCPPTSLGHIVDITPVLFTHFKGTLIDNKGLMEDYTPGSTSSSFYPIFDWYEANPSEANEQSSQILAAFQEGSDNILLDLLNYIVSVVESHSFGYLFLWGGFHASFFCDGAVAQLTFNVELNDQTSFSETRVILAKLWGISENLQALAAGDGLLDYNAILVDEGDFQMVGTPSGASALGRS